MIDCNEAVKQLWAYIEHEVDPVERNRIEDHLARCRRCCGEMEFAEEMRDFMARRPDVELPAGLQSRLERLIDDLEVNRSP
jgi:anti-sigma factor (TIGR02949 family)